MNSNILNIVQFKVTDYIGSDEGGFVTTDWDQAAVFYSDGSVKIIDVDSAKELAKNSHVKMSETTAEGITLNFEKYKKYANFDPSKRVPNVNPVKEKKKNEVATTGTTEIVPVEPVVKKATSDNSGTKTTTKKADTQKVAATTTNDGEKTPKAKPVQPTTAKADTGEPFTPIKAKVVPLQTDATKTDMDSTIGRENGENASILDFDAFMNGDSKNTATDSSNPDTTKTATSFFKPKKVKTSDGARGDQTKQETSTDSLDGFDDYEETLFTPEGYFYDPGKATPFVPLSSKIPKKNGEEKTTRVSSDDDEKETPKKSSGVKRAVGFVSSKIDWFQGVCDKITDAFHNVADRVTGFFKKAPSSVSSKAKSKKESVTKKASDYVNEATTEYRNSKMQKKAKKSKKKADAEATKKFEAINGSNKKYSKKRKKRGGLFKKAAAVFTAIALALGLSSCTPREGVAENNNGSSETQNLTDEEIKNLTDEDLIHAINSGQLSLEQVKEMLANGTITNDVLDGLSFDQLLAVSNSETQKREMSKIGEYLEYFNGTFADRYLESNHPNVRAALSWDEVMALNLAYNDFSKEDIKAMINGAEVDSYDLTNAYKEGTLQLMGAFVLETRDMPVDLSNLLNSQEGIDFYNKYNELFLRCKETSGQDQIDAVNAFYQELYKDFPISSEVREVGISHSEARDDIVSYKLSITPMVAATEMMFQNLEIDHTLSDPAIAYFNDLGLCNYAQGTFDRVENISYCIDEDESLPTYNQFADKKIEKLKAEGHYFTSDKDRDLSQLDLFQKWVNGHFDINAAGEFVVGSTISSSISSQVVDTYTESTTTYRTEHSEGYGSREDAVNAVGEAEVSSQEQEIQNSFNQWNEQQKAEGEAAAEENRQELQDEADKEAEQIRDEIEKDDQDLQDKIEDANDQIEQGGQVNEDDFGDHGVDFDDSHSSSDGTLDDSVGNITTDDSGVGEELPDPNESGNAFDQEQPDFTNQPEGTIDVGTTPDGDIFIEYEEEVEPQSVSTPVSEPAPVSEPTSSNVEAEVDAMIEDMANAPAEEEVYVYTKN